MHRFFVALNCIQGERVALKGDTARQLARVLRARLGDEIIVLDNTGWEYQVTLDSISPGQVLGSIKQRYQSSGETRVAITLVQAVLKAEKFEFVLQKGTELGVSAFVPVFCDRTVPKARDKRWAASRLERWGRIVTEAAEQSGRGRIPKLDSPVGFCSACDSAEGLALVPW